MQIEDYKRGNVTVIKLNGEITHETSDGFRDTMQGILNRDKSRVIINMEGINFINSMAVAIIVSIILKGEEKHGNIVLVKLKPEVQELFKITRLLDIFTVFATEEEAIEYFSRAGKKPRLR